MKNTDDWKLFSWHCVNCGQIVSGFKNSRNDIKAECPKCHTTMVRALITQSHDKIDVYTPKGMERL